MCVNVSSPVVMCTQTQLQENEQTKLDLQLLEVKYEKEQKVSIMPIIMQL